MHLVAVMRTTLALARRQRRVRIDRFSFAVLRGWPMWGLDQARIDHGAALEQQPALVQLLLELREQFLRKSFLGQTVAEPAERGVIRRRIFQRQSQKPPERYPIVQGFLQFRVRQPVPLLQQQRLQHQQRIVGRPARTLRLQARKQLLKPVPLHIPDQPIERLVAPDLAGYQRFRKAQLIPIRHLPPPIRPTTSESQKANYATIPTRGRDKSAPTKNAPVSRGVFVQPISAEALDLGGDLVGRTVDDLRGLLAGRNLDVAGLLGLGNLADEVDMEQAVLERGVL